jgi:hypothetical protein
VNSVSVSQSSARERGPARPPRLSSYYPGFTPGQEEGSGLNTASFLSSSAPPPGHSGSSLIVPTRSSQYLPTSSSIVRLEEEEEDVEEPDQPVPPPPTNHKPFIANRLDKLPLIAGKSSRIIIPANTFQDLEAGSIVFESTGMDSNPNQSQTGCSVFVEALETASFETLCKIICQFNFKEILAAS